MKTFLILLLLLLAQGGFVQAKEYDGRVLSVYDGDTCTILISLGLDIYKSEKIRLVGLDAPEMDTDEGKAVQAYVEKILKGKQIVLKTDNDKHEKYGRLLGTIFFNGENINERLIKEGKAKPYDGGKR